MPAQPVQLADHLLFLSRGHASLKNTLVEGGSGADCISHCPLAHWQLDNHSSCITAAGLIHPLLPPLACMFTCSLQRHAKRDYLCRAACTQLLASPHKATLLHGSEQCCCWAPHEKKTLACSATETAGSASPKVQDLSCAPFKQSRLLNTMLRLRRSLWRQGSQQWDQDSCSSAQCPKGPQGRASPTVPGTTASPTLYLPARSAWLWVSVLDPVSRAVCSHSPGLCFGSLVLPS